MIIENLEDLEKSSDSDTFEKELSKYILEHQSEVGHMTIRTLSEKTYISTTSIVRFTRKLGCEGFQDFKMQLNAEIYASRGVKTRLNADFPIYENEKYQEIIQITRELKQQAIEKTKILLDKNSAFPIIIKKLGDCTGVDIYGEGFALDSAVAFKNHMNLIGYDVFLDAERSWQLNWAARANEKHLSIIISYSGESEHALKIAKILKKRKMKSISITCEEKNALSQLVTWNILVAKMETRMIYTKVSSISSNTAFEFVLDVLYLSLFSKNYEENVTNIIKVLELQEYTKKND